MNLTWSTLLIPKRAFSNAVGYFTAGEFFKKCVRYFGVELSNGRCAMIATTKLMTLAKGAATAQYLHKSEPSLCLQDFENRTSTYVLDLAKDCATVLDFVQRGKVDGITVVIPLYDWITIVFLTQSVGLLLRVFLNERRRYGSGWRRRTAAKETKSRISTTTTHGTTTRQH
jgi:hypothetical protein